MKTALKYIAAIAALGFFSLVAVVSYSCYSEGLFAGVLAGKKGRIKSILIGETSEQGIFISDAQAIESLESGLSHASAPEYYWKVEPGASCQLSIYYRGFGSTRNYIQLIKDESDRLLIGDPDWFGDFKYYMIDLNGPAAQKIRRSVEDVSSGTGKASS